jgi:hypothetical protein
VSAAALQQTPALEVAFRHMGPGDEALVRDSWVRTFRYGPLRQGVPEQRYFTDQRNRISRLLERGAQVLLAINPEDASQVLGWACFEKREGADVLHYLYVKSIFRRDFGIARRLLAEAGLGEGLVYTHHTHDWLPLAMRLRATYRPDLLP